MSFALSWLILTLGRHVTGCPSQIIPRANALPQSPAWRTWGFLKAAHSFSSRVSNSPLYRPRAQLDAEFSFNPAVSRTGWGVQRHLHPTQKSSIIHLVTLLKGSPLPCTHIPPEIEDDGPLHPAGGRQPSKPYSSSPQEKLQASIRCGLPVYAPELTAEPWQTLKIIM